MQKLTEKFVRQIELPNDKNDWLINDSRTKGLYLRLNRRKSDGRINKSFLVKYISPNSGKTVSHTLGSYPAIKPEKAVELTNAIWLQIAQGIDPKEAKKQKLKREVTLDDLIALYKTEMLPNLAHITQREYLRYLDQFISPDLGKKPIEEITGLDVERLYKKMLRTSGSQAEYCYSVMSVLFRKAFKKLRSELYPGNTAPKFHNPVEEIDPKIRHKPQKRECFLTSEETVRLIDALHEIDHPALTGIILLCLHTGLRGKHVIEARWEDIDLSNGTWTYIEAKQKHPGPETIDITDAVMSILTALPSYQNSKWLFPSPKLDQPVSFPKNHWGRVRKIAGLPELFKHGLRHNFISNAAAKIASPKMVQELSKHKDDRMTQHYTHVRKEQVRIERNKLSEAYLADFGDQAHKLTSITRPQEE